MRIARRVQDLKPSVGFELLKLGKDLKDKGEDIVSLAIGELQWKTYKPIRQAAQKAIEEGYTKYSQSAGRETLRKKLSEQASRQFGLPLFTENVFVGNGCKAILFHIFQTLCESGDEVLLPAPYWMSYPPAIELSGAKVHTVSTKEKHGFKITAEELKKNISKKTKIFFTQFPP